MTPADFSLAIATGAFSCAIAGSPPAALAPRVAEVRIGRDLDPVLLGCVVEEVDVDDLAAHEPEHARLVVHGRVTGVLRLLPHELLADELGRVHRPGDRILLTPAVRGLFERGRDADVEREHRDLRPHHRGVEDREILGAGVEDGERLHLRHRDRVCPLRRFVVTRRRHELEVDVAPVRVFLAERVLVARQPVG